MSGRNEGFTIIEVLVAIVILAVGMLALATTSIFATTQVRVADLKTERSLAVQEVVERMLSSPFDEIQDRSETNAEQIGSFAVWWDEEPQSRFLTRVLIVSKGPGYQQGVGWIQEARDSFIVEIADPAIPNAP